MMRRGHRRRARRWGFEALETRRLLVADSVVITEIMYHPELTAEQQAAELGEDDLEFIELMNIGGASVPLAGLSFTEGITFTFDPLRLDPGQRIVVVGNVDAFQARYGSAVPVAGQFGGSLGNRGEGLLLQDANGGVLFDFHMRLMYSRWTSRIQHRPSAASVSQRASLDLDLASSSRIRTGVPWRTSASMSSNVNPKQAQIGALVSFGYTGDCSWSTPTQRSNRSKYATEHRAWLQNQAESPMRGRTAAGR